MRYLLATIARLQAAPAFPLKVSEKRRGVVDQGGTPFLCDADTPRILFTKLTKSETREFIARRKASVSPRFK